MLVSLGVILYFIPYLYMFAALLVLQKKPVAEGVIRVPAVRVVAYLAGATGFLVTALSIVLSFLSAREGENRAVFFAKISGFVGVTLGLGMAVYFLGKRRVRRLGE
jgi:glutamate:GABA antiporter